MLDLLPVPADRFACPCGGAELENEGFHLSGMVPMARTRCPACGRRFLAHLHTGFCQHADFLFEESTGAIHTTLTAPWYRDFLAAAMASIGETAAPVERVSRRPLGEDVLLLNCLDPVYGHCLQRLISLDFYRDNGFRGSVVAILPRFLAWLASDDIDELWIVDTPLRQGNRANATIAVMAQALASSAKRLRYADMIFGHKVDITRYTHVPPFAVDGHDSVSPPRLTLNWREDRCWTIHGKTLPEAQAIQQQRELFTLLLQKLRQEIPDLDAAVTGYGRSGEFPDWVQDMRLVEHDTETEKRWAKRYAFSHLTFGMHGSNMILPASLSIGAIELVPTYFWPHILVTWEWVNRLPASTALVRYRQLPVSASVSDIVSITLMQLRRMQSTAAYGLMHQLRDSETPAGIMFRHEGAFRHPEAIICLDNKGEPF